MKNLKLVGVKVLIILFCWSSVFGQNILINELVSSNNIYFDDFSNTPDWFELYNASSDVINLDGMKISDKDDFETAWSFAQISLLPGQYLLVFASGDDIKEKNNFQTIIKEGDEWKYKVPSADMGSSWRTLSYDDSSWSSGSSGFGYGDGDDNTVVSNGTRSIFLRKDIDIENPQMLTDLYLHVDYDDGFVAYINGFELSRANLGTP